MAEVYTPTRARIVKLGAQTAVIVRTFGRLEVRHVMAALLRPARKVGRLVFKPATVALMRRKPKPAPPQREVPAAA